MEFEDWRNCQIWSDGQGSNANVLSVTMFTSVCKVQEANLLQTDSDEFKVNLPVSCRFHWIVPMPSDSVSRVHTGESVP